MSVKIEPGEIPYYKEYIPAFNLEQYAIQYYRSYNASKIIYYDKLKKELEELNDRLNKLMIEEKVQKEKLKRFDGLIYRADALRSRYDHLLKLFRPDIYDRIRFDKPTAKLFIRSDRKKKITKNLNYTTKPHQDVYEPAKIEKKKPKKLIVDEVNNVNLIGEIREEDSEPEELELLPPDPPQSPPPLNRRDQCGGNEDIKDYDHDIRIENETRKIQEYKREEVIDNKNDDEIIKDEIDIKDDNGGEEEEDDDDGEIIIDNKNGDNVINYENEVKENSCGNSDNSDNDDDSSYKQSQHKQKNKDDEVEDNIKDSFKDSFVNESKFERSDSK